LAAATLFFCLAASEWAAAQWIGRQTGCYADQIAANPNRPTVSNPANVTQYGVLELEYGYDHFWPEEGVTQSSATGLLKFGLLCDIEFRWNTTSFISQTDASGTHRSFGDNWLGTEVRLYKQAKAFPTMAVSYMFKVPSAGTEAGLGSGHVDHAFELGLTENLGHFTVDFNFTEFLIGRATGGFDTNQQFSFDCSHPIWRGLQFTGEVWGQTSLNDTPGFASSLWAASYTVRPRLVIDGGFEAGLTSGGPHRHMFFGATYAIGNVYRSWRKK
jgi:hypothetical protein